MILSFGLGNVLEKKTEVLCFAFNITYPKKKICNFKYIFFSFVIFFL